VGTENRRTDVYKIYELMTRPLRPPHLTRCYSNGSNSPHCHRAQIIQLYLPRGAYIYQVVPTFTPSNTWYLPWSHESLPKGGRQSLQLF